METVLVTGASRGIGLEHVRRFAEAGAYVFAAARDLEGAAELRALAAAQSDRIAMIAYDAQDRAAPGAVKTAIGDRPVDLLLNNAGVYGPPSQSFGALDADGFMETIAVNTLAPLRLAQALVENVAASNRRLIANQSSQMGSIADNRSGGFYAYRASKAALNMVTQSLARDLAPRGVAVVSLHPGWVRTRMGGQSAPLEIAQSVEGQQAVLARIGMAESGGFFNYDGARIAW